ncbi:hypothetical protein [Nostoc sp. LPT]|uniref:hypothetical protein n=1 Tax=Nostoc sp. LPT TaxID=2815387 RepID=UPI001E04297B|nr:hypothetical protein [Nostoc sp. LPT]MBN4006221.1 hypothetical protein [Nostoc sp. LPT]
MGEPGVIKVTADCNLVKQRGQLLRGDALAHSAGGKRVIKRLGVSPMSDCC